MTIERRVPAIAYTVLFYTSLCIGITACSGSTEPPQEEPINTVEPAGSAAPLFLNSIVSTQIDFITRADANVFQRLEYIGQARHEMPDSRSDNLFDQNAYVFTAYFSDNSSIDIWLHSQFGSQQLAAEYAEKVTGPLGRLPETLRSPLSHVVIHPGNETAFAEELAQFFVLYSDNMDIRISNNDLEETVFHESVHASLDATFANSETWKRAQQADGNFITQYGKSNPQQEDLAETAIFAYTMTKHPGRLSAEVEAWVRDYVPNRLSFITGIFSDE